MLSKIKLSSYFIEKRVTMPILKWPIIDMNMKRRDNHQGNKLSIMHFIVTSQFQDFWT